MSKKNAKPAASTAKVLIVDDHPVVREGLAMHVAKQPDLEVCGEAEDLPGALALLASTRPDVAIIDISLKDSNGLELIRRIKERHDAVRILVWSMYPESLYAERSLRAGAQGYLNKGKATHHVLHALRAILQGRVYVSAELANQLLHRAVGQESVEGSPIDSLSDRELACRRRRSGCEGGGNLPWSPPCFFVTHCVPGLLYLFQRFCLDGGFYQVGCICQDRKQS